MVRRKFEPKYKNDILSGKVKMVADEWGVPIFLNNDALMVVYYRNACYVYDYVTGKFKGPKDTTTDFYVEVESNMPQRFLDYFTHALHMYKSGFDEEDIENVAEELYRIAEETYGYKKAYDAGFEAGVKAGKASVELKPKGGIYDIKED